MNAALQQFQSHGAKISEVKVALGESLVVYLITYEALNTIG